MRYAAVSLVVSILFAGGHASAQTCADPLPARYDGPLFDAMAQTDQNLRGETMIAIARSVGVTRMALFARVHKRQDGRGLVASLAGAHPEFILEGAPKLFEMRGDLDGGYVGDVVSGVASGRYKFVGEILYAHGDKEGGEDTGAGERYIDPTQPNTARLVAGLRARPVPIMTHWEVYDWDRDWPRFDKTYGAFPGQKFVWPHAGFGSAAQLATVLGAHGNVTATLSKREKTANLADVDKEDATSPPLVDDCGVLYPEWRKVIADFQDRLMFATDAHKANRWDHYAIVVRRWRAILGQLPPGAARAIAFDNAARLYAGGPSSP